VESYLLPIFSPSPRIKVDDQLAPLRQLGAIGGTQYTVFKAPVMKEEPGRRQARVVVANRRFNTLHCYTKHNGLPNY